MLRDVEAEDGSEDPADEESLQESDAEMADHTLITTIKVEHDDTDFPHHESTTFVITEEKAHICCHCGQNFSRYEEVEGHEGRCEARTTSGACGVKQEEADEHFSEDSAPRKLRHRFTLAKHRKPHSGEHLHRCTLCPKSFTLNSELAKHLRTHAGEKSFRCLVCNKCFAKSSNLNKHKKMHTTERSNRCPVCPKTFSLRSLFFKHIESHKEAYNQLQIKIQPANSVMEALPEGNLPYGCVDCGKTFGQRAAFFRHRQMHFKERAFQCPQCGKAFVQKSDLTKHSKIHSGERPFRCQECDKAFIQRSDLVKHQRTHSGEKPFQCAYCHKAFSEKSALAKHQRTHFGYKPYKCAVCGKGFTQKGALILHHKEHGEDRPLKCRGCDENFSSQSDLDNHQKSHETMQLPPVETSGDAAPVRPTYKCDKCDRTFRRMRSFLKHKNLHSGSEVFPCTKCNRTFVLKSELTKHHRSHDGAKSFRCMLCQETFMTKSDLQKHWGSHDGQWPYSCHDCNMTFPERLALLRHRRSHGIERPYECSNCEKAFTQKCSLKKHMRSHMVQKPYTCDQCGKSFIQNSDLVKHQRVHTGDRPYPCPECSKGFSELSSLAKHRRTHARGRLYRCLHCTRTFKRNPDLVRHLASHASESPNAATSFLEIVKVDPDDVNGDREKEIVHYPCPKCSRTFLHETDLNKHLITHCKEGQSCNKCDKTLLQASDLPKHLQTHAGLATRCCAERDGSCFQHLGVHSGGEIFHSPECNKSPVDNFSPGRVWTFSCDKSSFQKVDLVKPLQFNSGAETYQSPKCDRSPAEELPVQTFSSLECNGGSELCRHLKRHSDGKFRPSEETSIVAGDHDEEKIAVEVLPLQDENQNDAELENKIFKCSNRGQSLTYGSSLVKHLHLHKGERGYISDRSIIQVSDLATHLCSHTEDGPYSFSKRSTLASHHLGESNDEDSKDDLSQGFGTEQHRVTLEDYHRRLGPESQCVKREAEGVCLSSESQNQLAAEVKPYCCPHCDQTFSNRSSFLTHKRTHAPTQHYACTVCAKVLSQRSALRRHMRSHTD